MKYPSAVGVKIYVFKLFLNFFFYIFPFNKKYVVHGFAEKEINYLKVNYIYFGFRKYFISFFFLRFPMLELEDLDETDSEDEN